MRQQIPRGTMTITFGGNGFFGYMDTNSAANDPDRDSAHHIPTPGDTLGWWSTYGMDECPDAKTIDADAITRDLRTRHAHWHDPIIQEIIQSVQVETMWPVWTTPSLPIWDRDGILLLGDAAHALPPTSGQGAAQALEDSESFALFLAHYLDEVYNPSSSDTNNKKNNAAGATTEKDAINLAAKKHMALRYPRVKMILDDARSRQQSKKAMNIATEFLMYLIMWLAGECFFSYTK